MYSLKFAYDKRGHGHLELLKDGEVYRYWEARCGSVNASGELVKSTPPATYTLRSAPVETTHPAMIIDGFGWWWVMYDTEGKRTRLGIHPDGGKGGTEGCVGLLGTNAKPLFEMGKLIIKDQGEIELEVTKI